MPSATTRLLRKLAQAAFIITSVAAALLLRKAIEAVAGGSLPTYITFYPAVMLAAVLLGLWAGLLATIASVLAVIYFVLPPSYGLPLPPTPPELVGIALFLSMGLFMSVVAKLYRRSHARAATYHRELALRESQRRYRDLFENMTEGFALHEIICDAANHPTDYRFLDVNPAFERLTGLRRHDVLGKTFSQLFPHDDPRWLQMYADVALTGRPAHFENYSRTLDRYYEVYAYPTAPRQFAATFSDVTERKVAENELSRRNAVLRGANRIFEAALTCDTEQKLGQVCLEVAQQITASTIGFIGELKDNGLQDLAVSNPDWNACQIENSQGHRGPIDGFKVHGLYGRVLQDNRSLISNDPPHHPDSIGLPPGHPPLTAFLGVPLLRDGTTIGMIAVANREGGYSLAEQHDLEALTPAIVEALGRKRAEEALRKAHAELENRVQVRTAELRTSMQLVAAERLRFRQVLDQLPAYLVLLTPSREIKLANRFFEDRFGQTNGRRCYEYLFHRQAPCESCVLPDVLASRRLHQHQGTGSDGRVYDIYSFPFTDIDGSDLVMEVGLDITQRHAAEQALRQRSAQLHELASKLTLAEQRERRRLAEILHDHLQQLLVGARFRMSALHHAPEPSLRQVSLEVDDLIAQSIEVSRSLTGELSPPILHEAGLVPALEWLALWMQEKHHLAVELKADAQATPQTEDLKVLLFQSVRELLFNAVKHAKVNKATVQVQRHAQHLRVVVSDEGCGFDVASLTSRAVDKGGFGLFSIRERMGFLGGHLEIDSHPGRGSRFTLVAPIRKSDLTPSPWDLPLAAVTKTTASAAPPPPGAAPRRVRVLLVDDHIVVRQGLARLLQEEPDFEIVGEASDGASAVELARQLHPDVVTMDLNMPGMNGIEATKRLLAEWPHLRVIGLSMFDQRQRAAEMLKAGAVNFLPKSGPAADLLLAIRAAARPSPIATPSTTRKA